MKMLLKLTRGELLFCPTVIILFTLMRSPKLCKTTSNAVLINVLCRLGSQLDSVRHTRHISCIVSILFGRGSCLKSFLFHSTCLHWTGFGWTLKSLRFHIDTVRIVYGEYWSSKTVVKLTFRHFSVMHSFRFASG